MWLTSQIDKIQNPNPNFNLLFLQPDELYISLLGVQLLVDQNCYVEGQLRLCSRSFVFQPLNSGLPILRFKYSNSILVKLFSNINQQQILNFNTTILDIKSLKEMFTQQSAQKVFQQTKFCQGQFLRQLFNQGTFKPSTSDLNNYLFVGISKIGVLNRRPLRPYYYESKKQNYCFRLLSSRSETIDFLKHFDAFIKQADYKNTIVKLKYDIKLQKSQQSYQCRKVSLEGIQYVLVSTDNNNKCVNVEYLINGTSSDFNFLTSQVQFFTEHDYCFQKIGIELYFFGQRSPLLILFANQQKMFEFKSYLQKNCANIIRLTVQLITKSWNSNSITNYEYLFHLNLLANRSFNNTSQYPVFPWILHEYSKHYDLMDPEIFRDLTRPIGAINKHRLKRLKDRQQHCKTNNLYPSHYSTHYYVEYYLMLKIPSFLIKMQQSLITSPDKIFVSVEKAYYNSLNLPFDFKQLIPQFYAFDTAFLLNTEAADLGCKQQGQKIENVQLPPWSQSADDFLAKMRNALECPIVTCNLNKWVDLIFGVNQKGNQAIANYNDFCDLRQKYIGLKVADKQQKLILGFGQLPFQVYREPVKTVKYRNQQKKLQIPLENIQLVSSQDIRTIQEMILKLDQKQPQVELLKGFVQRLAIRFNDDLSQIEAGSFLDDSLDL